MPKSYLSVHHLSFSYGNSVIPIINRFSCQFESGWTGIVGANGCGKTTLLKLLCGHLIPDTGTVGSVGVSVYCEQRTDFIPNGFSDFLESYNETALRLKSILGIQMDWLDRWETLSHGECKRAQIAVAMAQEQNLLAIDEPSNHLDRTARQAVYESLKQYRGIGLLVSHDRMLLDGICHHILLMDPPDLIKRIDLNADQLLYIPQEIDVQDTKDIIQRVHALTGEEKGRMMAIISRLGSDPVRVLDTELPSPGEVRKLMLASGIQKNSCLIIMDEPTNHMDLPSIQHVEHALNESHVALLLVSHDEQFLQKTVKSFWRIEKTVQNQYRLTVG